jgi:hypothetical protein
MAHRIDGAVNVPHRRRQLPARVERILEGFLGILAVACDPAARR